MTALPARPNLSGLPTYPTCPNCEGSGKLGIPADVLLGHSDPPCWLCQGAGQVHRTLADLFEQGYFEGDDASPPSCPLCDREPGAGDLLCPGCRADLEENTNG